MKIILTKQKKTTAFLWLKRLKHNAHFEIEYIYVYPEYRGSGLGSLLLKKAKRVAKDTALVAFIEPHRDSSLTYDQECEWFIRHGFVKLKLYDFGNNSKPAMICTQK